MPIRLNPKSKFVFIGDSITDCGRGGEPEGIGSGYVRLVRDYLRAKDPGHAPEVINRGVSPRSASARVFAGSVAPVALQPNASCPSV